LKKKWVKDLLITLCVIVLAGLTSFALDAFSLRAESIYLIYSLAVLVIIIETKKFVYGAVTSLFFVIFFNYFFIEPRFSFRINDPNNFVSLVMFLIVAFVISTLTSNLQKQIESSREKERRIDFLYQLSKGFLNAHKKEEIYDLVIKYLSGYLKRGVIIIDETGVERGSFVSPINFSEFKNEIEFAKERNLICGTNENKYANLRFKIFPIASRLSVFGAVLIECQTSDITVAEKQFIQNNITHLIVVLEREKMTQEKERATVETEKEKLKTSLLRSLSHDLRTPLTSIQGGASFLFDSFFEIDDKSKKAMLYDIYNEACELSAFVDNLLNMTRIDSNKRIINRKIEMIDDILSEVSRKVTKRLDKHTLKMTQSAAMIGVYTDASLLIQVIMNIIDNSIKHTRPDSNILLTYVQQNDGVQFSISDNGGGIKKGILDKIFDEYVTSGGGQDKSRNMGLGLSICKSIVEAHGGHISAFNNEQGGATFVFNIPDEAHSNGK